MQAFLVKLSRYWIGWFALLASWWYWEGTLDPTIVNGWRAGLIITALTYWASLIAALVEQAILGTARLLHARRLRQHR